MRIPISLQIFENYIPKILKNNNNIVKKILLLAFLLILNTKK